MIGLVILAAGASKRMGKPKQLLTFCGKTLLRNSALVALESLAGKSLVILGANSEQILPDIQYFTTNEKLLKIVENPAWEEGMASSIRLGIEVLAQSKSRLEAVIFMLCDQPFVSTELINELITTFRRTQSWVVACTYQTGITGVPALFSKEIFPALLALKGDMGARKIIHQFADNMTTIPFPKGDIDIDTPEAYAALLEKFV
jgi:molybdenum cofactor cytidylyltransferase